MAIHMEEGNLNREIVDDTSYVPDNVGMLDPRWNAESSLAPINSYEIVAPHSYSSTSDSLYLAKVLHKFQATIDTDKFRPVRRRLKMCSTSLQGRGSH